MKNKEFKNNENERTFWDGMECKICGEKIREEIPKIKIKKSNGPIYFDRFFRCENCKKIYIDILDAKINPRYEKESCLDTAEKAQEAHTGEFSTIMMCRSLIKLKKQYRAFVNKVRNWFNHFLNKLSNLFE